MGLQEIVDVDPNPISMMRLNFKGPVLFLIYLIGKVRTKLVTRNLACAIY